MHQRSIRGLVAAATTPFLPDLSPNHAVLARHCRRLIDQGCAAVLVLGTTGEANSLSVEERLQLLRALGDGGLGRALLVGVGCCALPDTVRLVRQALEIDAAGVLALPPFYYKGVTDQGVASFFSQVIERVADERLRFYLYHIPRQSGVPITRGVLLPLLSAHPGTVVGLKDSGGDWDHTAALLRELPRLSIFTGTEEHFLAGLRMGGAGCISATFNVIAREAAEAHGAFGEPDSQRADRLQQRLTLLRRVFAGHPMVAALKAVLARQFPDEGWNRLRPPLLPLAEQDRAALLQSLRVAGVPI